jgi:hypothetical protein
MQVRSGIALLSPAPPWPTGLTQRGPRLRSNDSGTWFEAACPFGSVRLCVEPGGETANHAAGAAIVLRGVEPLLTAFDDWIGLDLDWRWVEAPPHGTAGPLATARWRGAAPARECLVSWPWALLRALAAPAPALATQLEWPIVPAVLVLARLQIGPDELGLLEPGGAVLVPPSMLPSWQGMLRGTDEAPGAEGGVAVDLSTPWRPRLAASTAAATCATPVDPQRVACELRLDLPLGVGTQRLAGWRRDGDAGDIVHLAESGLRVALWRSTSARHTEQALASGHLMPWGDGWAFAVESLGAAAEGDVVQKV